MDKTNNIKRSYIWNKIYNIVKQIPRKEITDDSPDAPSVSTDIEDLFNKQNKDFNIEQFNLNKSKLILLHQNKNKEDLIKELKLIIENLQDEFDPLCG